MSDFELLTEGKKILLLPVTEAAIDYSLATFQYWHDLFSVAIAPEMFEPAMDGIDAEGLTVDIK